MYKSSNKYHINFRFTLRLRCITLLSPSPPGPTIILIIIILPSSSRAALLLYSQEELFCMSVATISLDKIIEKGQKKKKTLNLLRKRKKTKILQTTSHRVSYHKKYIRLRERFYREENWSRTVHVAMKHVPMDRAQIPRIRQQRWRRWGPEWARRPGAWGQPWSPPERREGATVEEAAAAKLRAEAT